MWRIRLKITCQRVKKDNKLSIPMDSSWRLILKQGVENLCIYFFSFKSLLITIFLKPKSTTIPLICKTRLLTLLPGPLVRKHSHLQQRVSFARRQRVVHSETILIVVYREWHLISILPPSFLLAWDESSDIWSEAADTTAKFRTPVIYSFLIQC